MANRSYLKSQKLKEMAADRQKLLLLKKENGSLGKEKASLEQKVQLLKEVIQRNRGNSLSELNPLSCFQTSLINPYLLRVDGTDKEVKALEKTREELLQSKGHCKAVSAEQDLLRKELSELRTTT